MGHGLDMGDEGGLGRFAGREPGTARVGRQADVAVLDNAGVRLADRVSQQTRARPGAPPRR
ncbi:MAG TPA: hypothetical protein VFC47_10750 [Caulobacteraceae bacterium]|nr:hypothetical protein [Caulobacteraceae bacterium]